MSTYYIYKAFDKTNGKIYIGKTNNLKKRRLEHEKCYKKEDCKFHRAIKKHGTENFDWSVVAIAPNNEIANELERKYISIYNSFGKDGYNMTKGGDGGSCWNAKPVVCLDFDGTFFKRYNSSEETSLDGYCSTSVLDSCKRRKGTCKGRIFMFEEDYLKNGARKYIKSDNNCRRQVIQCDTEGNFLAEYNSVNEAAEKTKSNRTTISGVLNKKYKSANGFIFVYKEDFPIKDISQYRRAKKGKRIAQIDVKTGKTIKVFDRISEAGKELEVNYKAIQKVVDKKNRTAYGYKWISQ